MRCRQMQVYQVSPNTGPQATCLSGFLHFCCSEMFSGTGHSSTYCSWLVLCWPATKGEDCWNVDLPQPDFSPVLCNFLFHMYMACRGSIEVGCYLNIAALWASETAVGRYCRIVTLCSVPSFQNLTCLKISSVAWTRPMMLKSAQKMREKRFAHPEK